MKLRWSERAEAQFLEAITYLDGERPGSGGQLYASVQSVTETIMERPRLFGRVPGVAEGEVRRALLRRYGYWLIFEVFENRDEAIVLAVWHARRRPEGWRESP